MGAAPARAAARLQQHPVCSDWLFIAWMFGRCPHLPIDYYFLMVSVFERSCCVPTYVMEIRRCFKEAYAEAHLQINSEAKKQKCYYDRATSTAQLVLGDVVLVRNDTFQRKRKVKDHGVRRSLSWCARSQIACPHTR